MLGRLLYDSRLRGAFRADPARVLDGLGVCAADRPILLSIDAEALDAQAESLLNKRFHEVAKRIPGVLRVLGADARRHFLRYATASWPGGYDRHLRDALAFCRALRADGTDVVDPCEFNRLAFAAEGARLGIHCVRVSWRSLPALQVLFRNGQGRIREILLTLGPPRA